MRKIVVGAFMSLDGVMQAPGGPDEDPVGGFRHGGWAVPYFDEAIGAAVDAMLSRPIDLLLGRKTYDIFAAHWPYAGPDDPIGTLFDRITKFVATRDPDFWRLHKSLDTAVQAWQRTRPVDIAVVLDVSGSMSQTIGTSTATKYQKAVEAALKTSGVSHAILRPTVLFGDEPILANAIAWLCSGEASFVNGMVMPIDGGGAGRLW